ncbi:MAG: hypothetical protein COT61_00275 [Candidatus Portnoybacteria bacterium CG09_land_8_20_14_0_10_44_13]|uniref:Uncharacterized protein n=4 Tax=Candidatus Portnoyibacteriota TaxID=1817913 RepID=A0A2H0KPR6_9BACT|nr:MAG: hypothetical protein COV85_03655 [Candidatus Portnoybacteria bacterium CG11_big_fil_rev_8_21_14_0_20_44_10]PIS17119.1 MAG: hypothetical protein COT61_00275 [Candidatus Portnoybacteria bacterium CG09_land_8_20_14_0_10_44_13]PIZ69238.1 MAG: hypothetical protein COY11_04795 [Candidatus Portnoybacteria bacterium CG_4_10_14_0_2_um_filter_44_20]PJA62706.1 MAG: hypothetical protein CO161_05050 [Candidatus Portnoybacteria bacterium CG_4_9_14_3_um_filter_44_9]
MYIPTWLIIGVIILGIYYFTKLKKQNPNSNNMPNIFKQNFSYKLDIHIEPNWHKLYKKLYGPKSEKEFEKIFEEKHKKMEKDDSFSLWGRRYYFTEYYDSASGLTTRFQRVLCQNGKQYFYPIDEFGDRGYVFDSDSGLNSPIDENDKKREHREKLSVEIGEDFIRNDIWDKHIGGPKESWDYEKENYIFSFPLYEVFNFLFALGQRFHDTERNTIVKWPDHIEKKFEEAGIEYEKIFEFEPTLFDIEKHDKDFFEQIGRPKISSSSSDRFQSTDLKDKNDTYYGVELKIFRPGENDRIGEFPPRIK